jgi:protein-disulfide isomerase
VIDSHQEEPGLRVIPHTVLSGERWIAAVAVLFGALGLGSMMVHAQVATNCAPLDAAVRSRVLEVAARSMGTEPILPEIDHEELLPASCYWQLFVTLPHSRHHAVLYVSPDHRFVSPALWDLTADLDKEDAKVDAQLRTEAESDHPPMMGPGTAPVTLVLFSDLQCPYCANFSRMLEQYQKDNPGKIRVIFRNNPLPMHRWAKAAARSGICIAKQSPDAFWRFQDFVFARQKETTPDNLGDVVKEFLQTAPEVHGDQYTECMSTPYSETRLDRDLEEGSAYHIHSTPTLFINGRRYRGFANGEAFAAAVSANLHVETARQQGEGK